MYQAYSWPTPDSGVYLGLVGPSISAAIVYKDGCSTMSQDRRESDLSYLGVSPIMGVSRMA
jgi:hypothetical protein